MEKISVVIITYNEEMINKATHAVIAINFDFHPGSNFKVKNKAISNQQTMISLMLKRNTITDIKTMQA